MMMRIMSYFMSLVSVAALVTGETQLAIYGILSAIFIRICADDLN